MWLIVILLIVIYGCYGNGYGPILAKIWGFGYERCRVHSQIYNICYLDAVSNTKCQVLTRKK